MTAPEPIPFFEKFGFVHLYTWKNTDFPDNYVLIREPQGKKGSRREREGL
jgi:hypothetical protein